MTKKQFYLTLTLTVLAGFLGGLLSGFLLNAGIVRAQSEEVIHKVIRAEKFEVVSEQGKVYSTLGYEKRGGKLTLVDYRGEALLGSHGSYFATSLKLNWGLEHGAKISIRAGDNESSLLFSDENNNTRFILSVVDDEDKYSMMAFMGKDNTPRAIIEVDKRKSTLMFYDKYGINKAAIGEVKGKGGVTP